MFESILEKVLNKFLAQYVDGLDKENLNVGVWSGNVEVKNVTLKSDILLILELPLVIKFSHIGNLKLKVPWKSLGSSPVEAILSDVFIIISAQNPDQWVFQDYAGLRKKQELIEQFKEELIKKIEAKSKDSKDNDEGYVQKLVLKIIDNIQIEIKNIHIRFEDTSTNQYSWGIALNKIDIFTTDKEWNKFYFDRTKEENKNKPVQKLLKLSNLGIYWIQKETSFFHSLSKNEVLEKMREIIITSNIPNPSNHKFYNQYVLLLNLEAKLFQNRKGDFTKPEFIFELDLQAINLSLENLQLQQIIRLAELFTVYQKKLNQIKKQKLSLQSNQIARFTSDFKINYEKFIKSGKTTPATVLSPEELKLYEEAISNLSIEQLFDEVKLIVKTYQKDQMIKEAEKKKQESSKGWFGGWIGGKKQDQDTLLDEDTKKKLMSLVDSMLDGDQQLQEIQRPPEYVWLELHFILHGGFFHMTKLFENQREGVQMYYKDFNGQIKVMDASTVVKMELHKIAVDLTTELVEKCLVVKEINRTPILETIDDKFLDFQFETNPLSKKGVDKLLNLLTRSIQVTFNPLLIVRLQQFADLKVTNDDLKSAAWDQVEQVQDATAEQIQLRQTEIAQSVLQIDVQCAAPVILLPFGENEVWLINFGELLVKTPQKKKFPDFDTFEVNLDKLTFKYFNNLDQCIQMVKKKQHLGSMEVSEGHQLISYSVIQNFDISVEAMILKNKKAPQEVPQISVTGYLPKLDLCLQPIIYQKLLEIGDCFMTPQQRKATEQKIEQQGSIETDRTELMKKATKVGKLWKKNQVGIWAQNNAVLSEGYIYFFAKPKDSQPESWVWIKNSDFTDLDEPKAGIANAFLVKNKYVEIELATDKPTMATQWKDAIEKMRTLPRKKQKEDKIKQTSQEIQRVMKFGFELPGVTLSLSDEYNVEWMRLAIEYLATNIIIDDGLIDCELKLKSLLVDDSIHNYLNPFFKHVITSQIQKQLLDPELILVRIILINEKDKRYKKVNMDIDVTFGTLQAIIKPLTIAKLLVFINPQKKEEKQLTYEQQQKIAKENAKKQIVEQSEMQQISYNPKMDVIIMRIKIKLNTIKATLVHQFTYLPLADLNLSSAEIEFIKYSDEMYLTGSLGNIQLIDLTNYPDTLSDEKDYDKIQPKELIGIKDQSQSLLTIKLRLLSDGSTKIKSDNINLFLDVKMSSLIINYFMQPTMRLLDFLLSQFLYALSNPYQTIDPEYGRQKYEQIEQFEQSSIFIQSAILSEEAMIILKKQLENPPVMFINISIDNPQVILKHQHSSKISLIVDLGHIQVSNKRSKAMDRCKEIESGVWVDAYTIALKNLEMYWGSDDKSIKKEVTMMFDFNVSVELFPMATQYSILYPNAKFDYQMKIYTFMAPMIIQLSHEDYMFIMKCLFHNIIFDDGLDTMIRNMNPTYFQAFQEQQKQNEEKQKQLLETGDASPAMLFQLDAENLTAFLLDDDRIPFTRVTLVLLRLQFIRRNNGNMELKLVTQELEGSVFIPLSKDLFQEFPFIGKMNIKQEYSKAQMTNLKGLAQGKSFSSASKTESSLSLARSGQLTDAENRSNIFKFEDTSKINDQNPEYQLTLNIFMPLNKKMVITILLTGFKVMLHAGPLMQVLAVIAMNDPELTPPPGKYIKLQEPGQNQEIDSQGSLEIEIELKNVIICAPTSIEQNVLAIRGEFNIRLYMGPPRKIEEIIQEIKQKGIVPDSDQQTCKVFKETEDLNVIMKVSVLLKGLEVCICKAFDISRVQDFKIVKKREILLPLIIDFSFKRSLVLTLAAGNKKYSFTDRMIIDIKITKVQIKISFRDMGIMRVGLQYQLSQLPQQPDQPPVEEKKEVIDQKQLENLDITTVSDLKIDYFMPGLKVIILNDIGNTFSPLLDFELLELAAKVFKNNVLTTVTLAVPFKLAYYNPRASMWEPVIEPTSFNIEYYTNQFGSKMGGTIITIEQNENFLFNITISTMFIQILFKTLYLLKKISQPQRLKTATIYVQEEEEQKQLLQDEVFAQVSPYIVRNLTGCFVTLEPQVGEGISKSKMVQQEKLPKIILKPNEQSNIQMSIDQNEKIEVSIQKKVHIGITIPSSKNQFLIKDIDMDRIKSKLHAQDHIKVFTTLKLDNVTNSKMLTVSSNIIFVNHTNERIDLKIVDKNHESVWKLNHVAEDLVIGHVAGVPIGLEKPRFSLRFSNNEKFSNEMILEKVIQRVNGGQSEFIDDSNVLQINTSDNRFIFLHISQDNDMKGRCKINLEAPFKITNSLPKDIYIQLLNEHKDVTDVLKLNSYSSFEDYKHSQFKRVYLRVLLEGFYWSDEYNLCSEVGNKGASSKKDCINELPLIDADSNEMSLLIYEPWRLNTKGRGSREFIIHCTGYLMNQSPYKLAMCLSKDERQAQLNKVPGQEVVNLYDRLDQNIVIFGPHQGQKLALTDQSYKDAKSPHPTSLSGIGSSQLDLLIKTKDGKILQVFLGTSVSIKNCNNQHTLLNKIVSIEPRFLLVNQCTVSLLIKPKEEKDGFEIEPNKRVPYQQIYLEQNDFKRQIVNFNYQLSENFHWSGEIDISSVGIIYFQLRHQTDSNKRAFFCIDTREEGCNIFVIIKELERENAPYKFINSSSDVDIKIFKKLKDGNDKQIIFLEAAKQGEEKVEYFAWDEQIWIYVNIYRPCFGNKQLWFQASVTNDQPYKKKNWQFKPDHVGMFKVHTFSANNLPKIQASLTITANGYQKVIHFQNATKEQIQRSKYKTKHAFIEEAMQKQRGESIKEDQEEEKGQISSRQESKLSSAGEVELDKRIDIKIHHLTLSLVHNADHKKRPAEYIFITIKQIYLLQLQLLYQKY